MRPVLYQLVITAQNSEFFLLPLIVNLNFEHRVQLDLDLWNQHYISVNYAQNLI